MGAKVLTPTFVLDHAAERPLFLGVWLKALLRLYRAVHARHFFYDAERAQVMAQRHADRLAQRYPPPFRF